MQRRTRITLSIPWDDDETDHPAQWGYDVLLGLEDPHNREVLIVDFEEVDERGQIVPV